MTPVYIQISLSIFSLAGLFCITRTDINIRKYGPIFGLCSQPFWLYSTYSASQFGMFILSIIYTCIWVNTIYTLWIKGKN